MLSSLRKHWFLLGVLTVISLAKWQPWVGTKGGPLLPEITVKYIAVSMIFFCNGLQLKTDVMLKVLSEVKVHLSIQIFTFIFIPAVLNVIVQALRALDIIDPLLLQGLTVVSCMPPPVSSAVILTSSVLVQMDGEEKEEGQKAVAAAVFNSVFGSFMGIIISPLLVLSLAGVSSTLPFVAIVTKLSITVVLPLFIGQVVRFFIKSCIDKWNIPFSQISSFILLLIIYTTFCDTFTNDDVTLSPLSLLIVVLIIVALQCCLLVLSNLVSNKVLHFSRPLSVSAMFCSTHKSLTLGIPMMKIVFAGEPGLSILSIPLLIYHPTQILLGAGLVPLLQKWVYQPTEGQ